MQASKLRNVASSPSVQADPRSLFQQLRQLTSGLSKKKRQQFDQICHQLADIMHLGEDPFAELKSFGSSLDDILPHREKAEPLLILSTIAFQLELRGEPYNEVELAVCSISGLLAEMADAGLVEYLESAAGDYAAYLPDVLNKIGAKAHAGVFEQVFQLLGGVPCADHDQRVAAMDAVLANHSLEQWQQLNLLYHSLKEPLAAMTMMFVENNKQLIQL